MKFYIYPQNISKVICSDLDETFMPYNENDKLNSGIPELEKFLLANIVDHSMIFGLITGSSLTATLRKINDYVNYYPHFIASSLGTELHWCRNNQLYESTEWTDKIVDSGYRKENINQIIQELNAHHISLIFESDDYQGKFKSTLYYYIRDSIKSDFDLIQTIASNYNIKVLFNRCNPSAGDPENCFDIEFIPSCYGKGEIVDFIMQKYDLSSNDVYCFGDSFNDFSMFERTKNSYLVGNADPEAKSKHGKILTREYCYGIMDKLQELFG